MKVIQNASDIPAGKTGWLVIRTVDNKISQGSYFTDPKEFQEFVERAWSKGDPGDLTLLRVERITPKSKVTLDL